MSLATSSDRVAHFGLGASRNVKLVEINWPSGVHQVLKNVAADRQVTVSED